MAGADPDPLRRALADAGRKRSYEGPELRDAVSRFAGDARSDGLPPERVLILVKQLVDEHAHTGLSEWWRVVLTDRVVRWAVEGYYRLDLNSPPPPPESIN